MRYLICTVALFAAVSGEAKALTPENDYNNITELVSPTGSASYAVEAVTQSNNYYNYLKNIQPSVDKYFPEYSSYFKNVLAKFKDYGTTEKYIINKHINEALKDYGEYGKLTSEKDKTATALIVFDYLEGESKFIKDSKINHKQADGSEDTKVEAATGMLKGIKWEYDRMTRDWSQLEAQLKTISKSIESGEINQSTSELISYFEQTMKRYKEYFIDAGVLKESKNAQEWFETYTKLLKKTGRQPNETGKIYINEYNKIKK